MKRYLQPDEESWPDLTKRPSFDSEKLRSTVGSTLKAIQKEGIDAVLRFAEQFDGMRPDPIAVTAEEFDAAKQKMDPKLKCSIDRAARNIEIFHRNQQKEFPVVYISKSIQCWQKDLPIEKVGFYIPGGTAPLFSTVLMLGIPAQIAGCQEKILCTPVGKSGQVDPAILYAADVCGIDHVFKIGGIQAVGAMAYGAGLIPKVDKIYGPGNQYVTMAKQMVSEQGVAIDMPAGPSEVLVIADEETDPGYVAADLLSQAEHGADSQVILLCLSDNFADQVDVELERQTSLLPRAEFARKALEHSFSVVMRDPDQMMRFSNQYAPEHLIIATKNARQLSEQVAHAGSVFIGAFTPESAGDYASGTNHTLPTNGYARSFSGLNLGSFMKTIQYQEIQQDGLMDLGPDIIRMADAEGLKAHSNAVQIRIDK